MEELNAILNFLHIVWAGLLAYMYVRLSVKSDEVKELRSREDTNEKIRDQSVEAATEMANILLRKQGRPPITHVAPVKSISHSPSTDRQRREAGIQTAMARLAATRLAIGLPAMEEPERNDEQ